jgi:hypothetical protein
MALVTGVFDEVPEQQPLPYISLGPIVQTQADAHNQRGLDVTFDWNIWSAYEGTKEVADILQALDEVFDRQSLAVAGWQDVSIALQQTLTVPDPDPDIRHITASYRVWLTKQEE